MRFFGMVTTHSSTVYTPYALRSFFECTDFEPEDRFFLIDNDGASNVSSYDQIGVITTIRNPTPMGFAANVNQIMRLASANEADLYFLNNDIIFTPRWLEPLKVPERAVLSPLSNWQISYAADKVHFNKVMDLADYVGNEMALKAVAAEHARRHQGLSREFSVWFFCIKIPFAVYREVGEMDESFGRGGGEDMDYCLRCHLAQIRVGFATRSFVLHFMGKSTWRGAETKLEQTSREQTYRSAFIRKWGNGLADFALNGDRSVLESNQELMTAYSQQDFRRLVDLFQQNPRFACWR